MLEYTYVGRVDTRCGESVDFCVISDHKGNQVLLEVEDCTDYLPYKINISRHGEYLWGGFCQKDQNAAYAIRETVEKFWAIYFPKINLKRGG